MARPRTPALLVVFAVTLAIMFAFATPVGAQDVTTRPSGPGAQSSAPVNSTLSQIEVEAIGWLQGFLRINTTNPPGNELVAAKYLADILQKNGIQSEIFESTPGRGIIVARLAATAVPDPSRALLLVGHRDVVGLNKAKWTVDPFGAELRDGYIYGRGAIDDKGMTIANLAVFIAVKRSGMRLTRDLIFLSEADEEAGGGGGEDRNVRNSSAIQYGFAGVFRRISVGGGSGNGEVDEVARHGGPGRARGAVSFEYESVLERDDARHDFADHTASGDPGECDSGRGAGRDEYPAAAGKPDRSAAGKIADADQRPTGEAGNAGQR